MKFTEIIAISGQPGLFKYVTQSNNGIIVESLINGKRSNATGTAKVSALSEISVFTNADDLPLSDIFTNIYKHTNGQKAIDPKSASDQLKQFFAEVVPDYDRDRVHTSDIKKIVSWYNLLTEAGMSDFAVEEAAEAPAEEASAENKK